MPSELQPKLTVESIYTIRNILIDNGADRVEVPIATIYRELSAITSEMTALRMLQEVAAFAKEVEREKAQGVALGSSDLRIAIDSIFYEQGKSDPTQYGLKTQIELRACAKLISMLTTHPKITE
ncbi:MAG TPA: hypothetical protein DCX25_03680 [Candidatus Pacebacteria bacterium]|nr:MAG: hypothetical protein UX00_C0008G0010 [Microgenomates group bacterium GW2011_GWB1_45_17]KKU23029.1 MAG: hypothetical protein UX35_C0012G0016 [Microgenomates group bacterium GW2011_GWA1_46_15]KKU24759.1 MAG: hypothetical protein UX36_C0001G0376 [Microgenomates group bacterium GW2011_GWC1_46_15]HAV15405.1 hypothetical protein [Candidatus Paceibacterota bacterium]HCR11536.1 hypothetical protein [Candidatus Paceibacterota bacterium]